MVKEDGDWISATHQIWKFRVFHVLLVCNWAILIAFVMRVNDRIVGSFTEGQLGALFIVSGASMLGWLIVAVRCPQCGFRPTWEILKSTDSNGWYRRLRRMSRCPRCGNLG